MKSVLFIAYYFPPMGLSGVQRTVKFAKYLPEFGWAPTVLTVNPVDYLAYDPSLLNELPPAVNVCRTPSADVLSLLRRIRSAAGRTGRNEKGLAMSADTYASGCADNRQARSPGGAGLDPGERSRSILNYISQAFLLPDNKIGWLPYAVGRGREILRKGSFSAIYATAPPFTGLLIGRSLRCSSKLPLVVDFRDAWAANHFARYATPLHRYLARTMERRVLRDADAVITINQSIADLLSASLAAAGRPKISVIPHGYDPSDFAAAASGRERSEGGSGGRTWERLEREKFTITYTGSFYERITPVYFLSALRLLLDSNPCVGDSLRVVFAGRIRREDERLIDQFRLRRIVEVVPYVSHEESVGYLLSADLLWVMIGEGKGSEMISTGKLFEYIGAGKPILATVPERGEAARIVRASGNGIVVPPDNVTAISAAIGEFHLRHARGALTATSSEFVGLYDRRIQAGQLAEIFDTIASRSPDHSRPAKAHTVGATA